ncbi:MAG: ABC transporter ATP-binding protein [Thermococcus sp.]|uniref:Peptide ABC transporter ATPase n=1 Tax=Thermococcus guaymasensis DSM 11113 TaxID=1432656 RepID=A0A0X1KIZ9_9EURY|nr:ABC transporter ATP-binding protein [Thermococcus guaymasensis]AJC71233.1 peptide ABC transporter ATPase [Thermococcus guaymasensis DSM 11113]MCD6524316.1 ABC transporter ATP-binding protein [Thermococcus sp.]
MSREILVCDHVTKVFTSGFLHKIEVRAVDDVSFTVKEGEIISLIGQSGSGKTTLGKIILRLLPPTSGNVIFNGKDIWNELKSKEDLKEYWRNVHAIFQNPMGSFNAFYKVDRVLNQALELRGIDPNSEEGIKLKEESLRAVGLNPGEILGKYPHQLSGGQLQRVMISRNWILKPKLLIADEAVSMLDVSTRGKIMELFDKLRKEIGSSIIFISHDIGLSYFISDRIFIMHRGRIVEEGTPEEVIDNPKDEYTKTLIASVPTIYRRWEDFEEV